MRTKRSLREWLRIAALLVIFLSGMFPAGGLFTELRAPSVHADSTPQTLPFSQNWSSTGQITTDDNWAGVPGIVGFRGDDLTTVTGTDPQTILADGSGTPVDVIANQANPNTQATGGVAEFDGIANPVVALQGSGTADAPHIVITINTTGMSGIVMGFVLRDIDGSDGQCCSTYSHSIPRRRIGQLYGYSSRFRSRCYDRAEPCNARDSCKRHTACRR